MSAHRLATGHVCAHLTLPEHLDITAARTAERALPGGWTLTATPATEAVDVEVTTGAAAVTVAGDTVCLRLPPAVTASDTLAYVTYTATERVRQQRRKVTVHATALIAPDGRAVLLLGANGAGKTSTAFVLAARGWTHAGDDLVVLGESDEGVLEVWPGKSTAAVRDPSRPLAPKPQHVLEPLATAPVPLGRVVRLAVHPVLVPASLTPALPLSVNERLRLHEMLARYISGLPTPITGVAGLPYGPVWPLDTPTLARWRSRMIAALADCQFEYLYAPNPETAAGLLTQDAETR
ncbi:MULTISPECIES: hypothetical protein [Frankia]|uniref:hypothetical protein n=1 Tax=Frankia TaxID=1854 RepID=UPI000461360B|nr:MULTISPECIES: hypothetical protein [Frankia]KDA41092.1 hypothetical protein BMG523Draft_04100 [Frankia sp. BMG5.23]ORT92466.1 hypothetical protein UK99_21960 [Frankia casuarinae]ORT93119.1 hypothetical protein UK99_20355 [Frankia casuarinae]